MGHHRPAFLFSFPPPLLPGMTLPDQRPFFPPGRFRLAAPPHHPTHHLHAAAVSGHLYLESAHRPVGQAVRRRGAGIHGRHHARLRQRGRHGARRMARLCGSARRARREQGSEGTHAYSGTAPCRHARGHGGAGEAAPPHAPGIPRFLAGPRKPRARLAHGPQRGPFHGHALQRLHERRIPGHARHLMGRRGGPRAQGRAEHFRGASAHRYRFARGRRHLRGQGAGHPCRGRAGPSAGVALRAAERPGARGRAARHLGRGFLLPQGQGELLVTSGVDSCFPKGIPVARVTAISTGGASRSGASVLEIQAEPLVDFHRLEEVFLLQRPADSITPESDAVYTRRTPLLEKPEEPAPEAEAGR